jgi:hypothetical protein
VSRRESVNGQDLPVIDTHQITRISVGQQNGNRILRR